MNTPLVSIIVISYNASKSIEDTLDSILSQTYPHLELIIADDHSTDDTAVKCENWISKNGGRFVRSLVIVNEENKGISANTNIGIKASTGEWIKIVGDDLLMPDAIESNLKFALEQGCLIVTSRATRFSDGTNEVLNTVPDDSYRFPKTNHEQYIAHIKTRLVAPSPTWFYKRELYDGMGGYDEHFRLLDDMPLLLKMLKSGYSLTYLPKVTLMYRITQTSLSSSRGKTGKQKQPYFECRSGYYHELVVPELKKNRLYGVLLRKNLVHFLFRKKIYSPDNSLRRYLYGICFTIVAKFENY